MQNLHNLELRSVFRNRSRASSDASTANLSVSTQQNPQPALDFTTHIDEITLIKKQHIGRDGNNEPQPYVLDDELRAYWTDIRVREIAQAYAPHLTIKYEVVNQRCLRLFSALVYTNRVQFFDALQSKKISDEQLPLVEDSLPQALKAPVYKEVLEDLYQHQWTFCPLILDYARLTDLELHPSHILPFQEVQEITQGDAAHIFKVKADRSCNLLHPRDRIRGNLLRGEPPSDDIYVLKSYHGERYRRLFLNEAKALTTLHQKSGNEHIVGYYGSFIQNDKFSLLLQFANAGSLLDYYRDPDISPPKDPRDICQFWKSLLGILKGLHQVHQIKPRTDEPGEYRGIHEDIKPDNILLNKTAEHKSAYEFIPILTDFGHSHFRVVKEEQDDEMGVDRQGNQTYGAPEVSRHAPHLLGLPSQYPTAADIWSIGCVISEAAAWVIFGPQGREEYQALRQEIGSKVKNFKDPGHYGCFHNAVDRSEAVDTMHARIREACHPEDTVTPQLLDLVQEYMLLGDWKNRQTAKWVYESSVKICEGEGNGTLRTIAASVQTRATSVQNRIGNVVKGLSDSRPFGGRNAAEKDDPETDESLKDPGPSNGTPELGDDGPVPKQTSGSRPKMPRFLWTRKDGGQGGEGQPSQTEEQPTDDEITESTTVDPADNSLGNLASPIKLSVTRSPTLPPRHGPEHQGQSDSALSPLSDGLSQSGESYLPGLLSPTSETSSLLSPHTEPDLGGTLTSRPPTPTNDPPTPVQPIRDVDDLAKLDLSLEEASKWRDDWKNWRQLHPEQHNLIRDLRLTLKGRDHIFLIDNSRTMKQFSTEVETAFETLAYIVKPLDGKQSSGSVSLAFGSTSTGSSVLRTNSHTSKLLQTLRSECTYERIGTVIEDVFSDFIDEQIIPRLPLENSQRGSLSSETPGTPFDKKIQRSVSASRRRSGSHSTPNASPISLIVFTNGQWGSGKDGAGVDNAIKRLTDKLKERELKRTLVTIQFLRFGDDKDGIRHLSHLATLGRADPDEFKGYSIVDTQPISGNVCSMLIGAISTAHISPALSTKSSPAEAGSTGATDDADRTVNARNG